MCCNVACSRLLFDTQLILAVSELKNAWAVRTMRTPKCVPMTGYGHPAIICESRALSMTVQTVRLACKSQTLQPGGVRVLELGPEPSVGRTWAGCAAASTSRRATR